MLSAGGDVMRDKSQKVIQFMAREPMDNLHPDFVHGMLSAEEGELELRWNSYSVGHSARLDEDGAVFIDGNDLQIGLSAGDRVRFSAAAPPLLLYEKALTSPTQS